MLFFNNFRHINSTSSRTSILTYFSPQLQLTSVDKPNSSSFPSTHLHLTFILPLLLPLLFVCPCSMTSAVIPRDIAPEAQTTIIRRTFSLELLYAKLLTLLLQLLFCFGLLSFLTYAPLDQIGLFTYCLSYSLKNLLSKRSARKGKGNHHQEF